MNYELIYKVRRGGYNTDSATNVEVGLVNRAREEAAAIHEKYREFIRKELGHEDFEVTNVACMADGIMGHVYANATEHKNSTKRGLGHRACIFCGCDDFDD